MKALYIAISLLIFYSTTLSSATTENQDEMASKEDEDTGMDQEARSEEGVSLYEVIADCNDTFRIPMGYLQALNESGSFPDETDKTSKCYVRCLLEKTSVASPEGEFDPGRTAVVFEEMRRGRREQIEATAKLCVERKETCKCERAYAYLKCLIQKEIEKSTET